MIYTLTLSPALDYDIYLDKLSIGELNLSKEVNFRAGGKGINVSLMLHNLGIQSVALGYIAGFTGQYIEDSLNKLGIKNKFIKTQGTNRINVKINEMETETEIAGLSQEICQNDIDRLKEYLKKLNSDDILVLSGSIPNNVQKNIYMELASITKAKVILDTRGSLLSDNIYNNMLIKPNIKELEEVFSTKIPEDKVFEYAKYFLDRNVENVMVSLGKNGAILIKDGKCKKANIPEGKYINSIGAGDSMVAGFIYSYINGLSMEDTLKFSVACGSATAYSYGIGDIKMIKNLIDKIEVKEL